VDILVALDISGSMAAEDFQPQNRLAVAKDVLKDFIRGRPSDRIGLALFAGTSITRSPLTLQHEGLIQSLEQIKLGSLPDGTAIGQGMMSGINRLKSSSATSVKGARILLLITDGRNNAGQIHPLDALPIAQKLKLRIYTVGVGSFGKVPFPFFTPEGKKTYRYEEADIDEPLLKRIAESTGGRYFRASDPKSMADLFDQINRLEKSEPQVVETRSFTGLYSRFAGPAFAIGFCYVLLTILIVRLP
jgi:Ca-activated chloride channel family protein